MADQTQILSGSFKGIQIRIDSASVTGGRKNAKHEFPNRDTQTVEDLGLRPRTYNLQIVVAPLTSQLGGVTNTQQSYFDYRDSLIAALEEKGAGELIHPLYGRIDNVQATSFSINEDLSDFGSTRIAVVFEISNDTGIPRQTVTALSQLTQANDSLRSAITSDITDNYSVTNSFTGNFGDAADKINSMVDAAVESTSFLGATADSINEFNSFIGELSASVNSLVTAPAALATSVDNMFSNIDGLFGTVENTAKAFEGLFGFGDEDENSVQPTTAARVERKQNRAVLNGNMNAATLGYAYVNVAQIEFDNVDEVEAAADALEIQYQAVVAAGTPSESDPSETGIPVLETPGAVLSNDVVSAATDMRVLVQQFFDEAKTNASQIITVRTNIMPVRVLTYQYYGSTDLANDIIGLNNIADVSFVEGDVRILTE